MVPVDLPRRRRPFAARGATATVLVLLLSACAGTGDTGPTAELEGAAARPDPFDERASRDAAPEVAAAGLAPPDPARPSLRSETTAPTRPRVDGDAPEPPPMEPVTPQRPQVRVDGVVGDVLPQVLAVEGVTFATVLAIGALPLEDGELRVAAVEPGGFRRVVPRVTAEHAGVWDRLAAGDVVLDHPAGRRLGARPGNDLRLPDGGALVVGAWASHAEPALADAVVTHATADELGIAGEQTVLVTLAEGAAAGDVAARLGELGLGEVTVREDVAAHTARLVGSDAATLAAFEPFRYVDGEDGRITVDPAWVDRHIVTADVPVLGEVSCHRELVPALRAALERILDEGLADRLDPDDYGGCFAPRHIDRSVDAGLSMHAWGLAVDVNVATNPLGAEPQLHPGVVAAFTAAGFAWGGDWQRPDGMHFELSRLHA